MLRHTKKDRQGLVEAGYITGLLWVLLQAYRMSISLLALTSVLTFKDESQSVSLLIVFFTIVGFWGLAAISGIFSYRGPRVQKTYWAALSVSELIGVPFSFWDVEGFLLWALIASPISLALAIYAFLGFMKLRTSLEVTEGISTTKNARNILIGFLVTALLVAWNVWYENIWKNKLSDVKNFMIKYAHPSEDKITPGYHTQPFAFSYWPGQASKHPWVHLNLDRFDLPELRLTNLDDCLIKEEDWERRDTVWGMGSGKGSVILAELLLNINRPEAKQEEFHLECEAGFRGVASLSAEVSLWLPGSFGWRPVA